MSSGKRSLIIVESPKKAKSLAQYLRGVGNYTIESSRGHFCDLAVDDLLDRQTWEESYVMHPEKSAAVKALKAKIRNGQFDEVLLATDPDREGEGISWHLRRELSAPKSVTVGRVRFRVINEEKVRAAVANPDQLDMGLVNAYRARRSIDRVVGYDVSGAVRRLNCPSAGRVQVPCNHLICDRERAILAFKSVDYWTVGAEYGEGAEAVLVALPDGRMPQPAPTAAVDAAVALDEMTDEEEAVATGGRGGPSGTKRPALRFFVEREATDVTAALQPPTPHRVASIRSTPATRKPHAPYTTSTFVQDAYRKFGITTEDAMAIAQALYEAGLISYHRTDAVNLDPATVEMLRARIAQKHPEVLPAKPPTYANKAAAQEGHEAIRPSRIDGVTQAVVLEELGKLGPQGWKLWCLITARALASQCKPAELLRTVIIIDTPAGELEMDGQLVKDPGFLRYWQPYAAEAERVLPDWKVGDILTPTLVESIGDRTKPPSRYNEASFNKKIDALGIGRPSTLATILATLRGKGYIKDIGTGRTAALQPTPLGMLLDDALRNSYADLVTAEYTASMEDALEAIATSTLDRDTYLRRDFYPAFESSLASAKTAIAAIATERGIVATGGGTAVPLDRTCPKCEAKHLVQMPSKDGGTFVCCADRDCGFSQPRADSAWKAGGCTGCGGTMVEYDTRDRKSTYWRCAKCKAFGEREPLPALDRQCPKCNAAPLVSIPRKQPPGSKSKKTLPPWAACQAKCGFLQESATTPWKEGACTAAGCGGTLVQRTSRKDDSTYWQCAKCTTTARADGTVSKYMKQAPVVGCPRCPGHPGMRRMVPRDPQQHRGFDTCDVCSLMLDLDAQVATVPCPSCGQVLVSKQRRPEDPPSWGCVGAPGCSQTLTMAQATARPEAIPPGPAPVAANASRSAPPSTAAPAKKAAARGKGGSHGTAAKPKTGATRSTRRPAIPD